MRHLIFIATVLLTSVSLFAAPSITGIQPNAGFSFGPTRVTITGAGFGTSEVRCPVQPAGTCPAEVFFGTAKGQVLRIAPTAIDAIAIPNATDAADVARTVDVRIVIAGRGEATAANAFRFDPAANPGAANYRKVLIPLSTAGEYPGTHGSIWRAELLAYNGSMYPIYPIAEWCTQPVTCPPSPMLAAGETESLSLAAGNVEGAFLYIPTPVADSIHLSHRARDISENATSWGAAIPTPSVDEFRSSVQLIDIPTHERYRTTLRIYSATAAPQTVRMRIYRENGPMIAEREIDLAGLLIIDPVDFEPGPAYAQLNPISDDLRHFAGSRVRIEVTNLAEITDPPPPPIWAFVSITHNETQQVTVVTPQ